MILIALLYLLILILKTPPIASLWKQWVVWMGGWHNTMETIQICVGTLWIAYLLLSIAPWGRKAALTAILAGILAIGCCDWQESVIMTFLFSLGWLMQKKGFYLWVILLAGVIPELTQLLYANRIFDPRDIVCNTTAVLLGYWAWRKK